MVRQRLGLIDVEDEAGDMDVVEDHSNAEIVLSQDNSHLKGYPYMRVNSV